MLGRLTRAHLTCECPTRQADRTPGSSSPAAFGVLAGVLLIAACVLAAPGCSTPSAETAQAAPAPAEGTTPPRVMPTEPEPQAPAVDGASSEESLPLRSDYPQTYVVQEGDTLWDISQRFLREPWYWPEIWFQNERIENPHLIFPGDRLQIVYLGDGADRRVGVTVTERGRPLVKLSPRVRMEPLPPDPIPPIPIDAISRFIQRPLVVEPNELSREPYVLDNLDGRLVLGVGDRFYARGFKNPDELSERYTVVREGEPLVDPDTGQTLGLEAIYIGDARVESGGDPATMVFTNTAREALKGDRLVPLASDQLRQDFIPKAPDVPVTGRVMALYDEAINQVGAYQIATLNVGTADGLEPGDVLATFSTGRRITDPVSGGQVKLPDEPSGLVVVFRLFEDVSYALVMESRRPVYLGDTVRNP